MKVDFIEDEHFIIYDFDEQKPQTEEELQVFFKMLNKHLLKQYHYEFHGFYNVTIYCSNHIFIMDFENIDDFGRADFNITMLLNSTLLFEFEDSDIVPGKKIYYDNKYYVELENMQDDIHLFEYGNIIYGDQVKKILNQGMLVSI